MNKSHVPDWKVVPTTLVHIIQDDDDHAQIFQCVDSNLLRQYFDSNISNHHGGRENDSFEEIYGGLSNIDEQTLTLLDEQNLAFQTDQHAILLNPPDQRLFLGDEVNFNKDDQSTGRHAIAIDNEVMEIDKIDKVCEEFEEKQKDQRVRAARAAEIHNLCERNRRNRIRAKLKVLQELVPNCHKTDRVSMLEDTINHIKALKQYQEQMLCMSMDGVALYQLNPNLPLAGAQTPQMLKFMPLGGASPYGMGMGMINMCYPALASTSSGGMLPLLPGPAAVQVPAQFLPSQEMPADFSNTENQGTQTQISPQNNTQTAPHRQKVSTKFKVLPSQVVPTGFP